jgi:DNA helicase II / ATP-dependent DNA helicase PcrA
MDQQRQPKRKFNPTPEQRDAATHRRSFVLVEANAGAGKTATIAERFGRLAFSADRAPNGILVCAFTREATGELRKRIESRFGPAALGWPHACWTIDELARHFLEILAAHGLVGRELHEMGGLKVVLDSWHGHPEVQFNLVKFGKKSTWKFQSPELGTFNKRPGTLRFANSFDTDKTFDIKNKRTTLLAGTWTHRDIRSFVGSCLGDPHCVDLLKRYVSARWTEVMVDECFDGNDEDIRLWDLLRSAAQRLTLFGDHWQAIFEFRRSDSKAIRAWAKAIEAAEDPVLRLAESKRHTPEMALFCETLRTRKLGIKPTPWVPREHPDLGVILGRRWRDLRIDGVVPDRLGAVNSCTFALLQLAYQQCLRDSGSGVPSSQLALWFGMAADDCVDVRLPELRALLGKAENLESFVRVAQAVFKEQGLNTKDFKKSLTGSSSKGGDEWRSEVQGRFEFARAVVVDPKRRVRGLTIHSAKGREWEHVAVVETADLVERLARRLDVEEEEDRVLFVGLSRARTAVYLYNP